MENHIDVLADAYVRWAPPREAAPAPLIEAKSSILADLMASAENDAGEAVNVDKAVSVAAVMACARVIAEGLAQIPCKLYRPTANGGREEALDHPVYRLLHRRPNDWQTGFEFRETIGLHLALTNNAFVFVNRDPNGVVTELLPFEPGQIEVLRNGYDSVYRYRTGKRRSQVIPAANMWHLRGPSWNTWLGLDPIEAARQTIGLSLATEKYGAKLFKNGARPGGVLSTEAVLQPEQANALREAWTQWQAGTGNAHRTAIMHSGLKWQSIANSADEAQFIETRKFQIEEICRVFRVLPIMVGVTGAGMSYGSVEQQHLAHLTHTLSPWHERFEQSAEMALLTPAEQAAGYRVKLVSRGMLRGSTSERFTAYNIALASGFMTANEVRAAEDLDRIDDPAADQLRPAANIFGPTAPAATPANKEKE